MAHLLSLLFATGDNNTPAKLPPNSDPFAIIAKLPQDQINAMKEKADEKFKNMPGKDGNAISRFIH